MPAECSLALNTIHQKVGRDALPTVFLPNKKPKSLFYVMKRPFSNHSLLIPNLGKAAHILGIADRKAILVGKFALSGLPPADQ
jgi:hypothetical protein